MTVGKSKFIGREPHLYTEEQPYDRINGTTLSIGVIDLTPHKKVIKTNKTVIVRDPAISRWYTTRSRAKRQGIEFDLSADFIRTVMESPCEYCGAHDKHSELDKKIPALGYVQDNIAPACRRCNTIKNNVVTYEEMIKIVEILGWRVS